MPERGADNVLIDFSPYIGGMSVAPLHHNENQKSARQPVNTYPDRKA
jgi:hypothetical protein